MATKIQMPRLSDTMKEGKLAKWLKKEGDKIKQGEIIAEIESDKANMELEAYDSGILKKIVIPEGGKVPVGALIAIIGEPDENIDTILKEYDRSKPIPEMNKSTIPEFVPPAVEPKHGAAPNAKIPEAHVQNPNPIPHLQPVNLRPSYAPTGSPIPSTTISSPLARKPVQEVVVGGKILASPLARKMATDSNIDLRYIHGSGPEGRIVKRDIEEYTKQQTGSAERPFTALEGYEDVELSMMRTVISKRLLESKTTIPHFYLTMEVDMKKPIELRTSLNEMEQEIKISYNDIIIKATARALRLHPKVNASFMGTKIRMHKAIHIGVAVALEDGLITPIIRFADGKSIGQIAREVKMLAEKARAKKLMPNEYTGGTFTLSNLGMYDVEEFAAIINPPEAAILAIGAVVNKPVVENGEVVVGARMKMTLACDHRVIDGATGAEFLRTIKKNLENPLSLVI